MFYQLCILCFLCIILRLWSKKRSPLEPPELSGKLPIVGHAYKLLGDGVKMYKSLKRISEEVLEKGGVVTMNLGPRKVYAVVDPEDSVTIMNASLDKHYTYNFLKPLLGNGLFTADAQTWKKNRKLLNPAFSQQVLDGYIEVFNSQSQSLVDKFETELGKAFDHETLLRINNLETICLTSFGIVEHSDLMKQYVPRLIKVIKFTNERLQKLWLHNDFIYNRTENKKIKDMEINHLLELTKSIIQNRKSECENLTNEEKSAGNHKTFVDVVLEIANDTGGFTDDQIREELNTIIVAGHDTISSLLTFALTLLGSHIDVQEKAYDEIFYALKSSDGNIDKDDLSRLVYIEAILKETLRLYPIGPILARCINKDIKLKNYTIKANSECIISTYGVHYDSIWGPDASQFRPDRWLDKKTLPDPKYFGAFGLGKRSCIGKVYAMMSMKITLAHVLRKYSISSDVNKMVVNFQLMTRPESGHYITLGLRNK